MAKRKKVENIVVIPNLSAAAEALASLGRLERKLGEIKNNMNESIDQVKAEAEAKAVPIQEQRKSLEAGLCAFAEHNRDELFKDRKTIETVFGSFGFRKSTVVKPKPKTTWKMILGKLKALKMPEGIRTKEEVNKDELHTWPDEKLDIIGARRMKPESFWYEPKAEELDGEAA